MKRLVVNAFRPGEHKVISIAEANPDLSPPATEVIPVARRTDVSLPQYPYGTSRPSLTSASTREQSGAISPKAIVNHPGGLRLPASEP